MIHCPLCSGPVHPEGDTFVCEVGHKADRNSVARHAEMRLAGALWMAMEALENESSVLRRLGGAEGERFADEADSQTRVLRKFARTNAIQLN